MLQRHASVRVHIKIECYEPKFPIALALAPRGQPKKDEFIYW